MEKNLHKTDTVRELGTVDVLPVLQMLPGLMNEWDKEGVYGINHNKVMSLAEVAHINFRWSDKQQYPVIYTDMPLWAIYSSVLLPIMRQAVAPIGYKNGYFSRVMLAFMPPGSGIPEHIDGHTRGWIAHKIHIPIITNPQARFFVKGQEYYFEKGKVYEVNNGAMHGARNDGNTARIHLIFEYLDADINAVPMVDVKQL